MNRADCLSQLPGTQSELAINKDIVVLPDHLFCRVLALGDLEQEVWRAQDTAWDQIDEWKRDFLIEQHQSGWMHNRQPVVPDESWHRRAPWNCTNLKSHSTIILVAKDDRIRHHICERVRNMPKHQIRHHKGETTLVPNQHEEWSHPIHNHCTGSNCGSAKVSWL
jgi:hypothetical protein